MEALKVISRKQEWKITLFLPSILCSIELLKKQKFASVTFQFICSPDIDFGFPEIGYDVFHKFLNSSI